MVPLQSVQSPATPVLPLSSIAGYVKEIILGGTVRVDMSSVEHWDALSQFPNIHRFTILYVYVGATLTSPLTLNLSSIFAQTTHLAIYDTFIYDCDVYHRFLLCFPAVTHLEVGTTSQYAGENHGMPLLAGTNPTQHPLYDNARAFASSIQSLTINLDLRTSREPILHRLLPLFPAGYCSVKRLSIAGWSLDCSSQLATLLAGFAKTLENLEIPIIYRNAEDPETLSKILALGMSVWFMIQK